jgi:glutamate-1-semialdehyde 2,1-aminomutase
MKFEQSEQLFAEAVNYMPGGVNSPVRAFRAVGRNPLFIKSAKGSKITDEDGNTFIDYVCSWGPGILGHAPDFVIDAVKEACEDGLTYGAPTKKEVVLAKLIREAVPAMEMLRLVSSGTEAVMSAIRVARGYTKRDKIVKFRGNYHGHSDGLLVKAGSAALTESIPDSVGVPADYTKHTLVAEYNSRESVEEIFGACGEQIACIIVEPVAANMGVVKPEEGFLQFLRQITREYGALLIFDEVITGFRLGYGGACAYYQIEPDLVTLGKIVGGGMPIGAYGGRREIMELIAPLGGVYQAGTLSGNPIATTAGIVTLEYLKKHQAIYEQLEEKARLLEQAFGKMSVPNTVNRVGSLMSVFFTERPVTDYQSATTADKAMYAKYFNYLLERGIYMAPSQFEAMFISAAHSQEDLAYTCDVIANF